MPNKLEEGKIHTQKFEVTTRFKVLEGDKPLKVADIKKKLCEVETAGASEVKVTVTESKELPTVD